jgi:hypothetical protein
MAAAEVSKEDRITAALAHGLMIAQLMGVLAAAVIWLVERDRSRWAAFQALQAAVYQFVVLLVTLASWVVWTVFFTVALIPIMANPAVYENAPPPPLFFASMAAMVIPFAIMGVLVLYGLVGGIMALMGHDFRYFILGNLVERFLDAKD